jgi:hypothetical protein
VEDDGGRIICQALTHNAHHVMLFTLTRVTRVCIVGEDGGGMICQALRSGGGGGAAPPNGRATQVDPRLTQG